MYKYNVYIVNVQNNIILYHNSSSWIFFLRKEINVFNLKSRVKELEKSTKYFPLTAKI